VSSGGVEPAAGVTWAAQGSAPVSTAVSVAPSRRRTFKWLLNTLSLLENLQVVSFARITGTFPVCKQWRPRSTV
jgi:hypothetical protein